MARPPYHIALEHMRILQVLRAFDPRVAGTLPLGVAVETSDIDIVCHVTDQSLLIDTIWNEFSHMEEFSIQQWVHGVCPIIASFRGEGWEFEIFASTDPVDRQAGWRHFCIEARLLELGGATFRDRVMALRRSGLKTEPAFAAALGLGGDPYNALLDLETCSDDELRLQLRVA